MALDANWVAAIGAGAGAVGAFLGWLAVGLRNRRETLATRVAREVEAKIGSVMLGMRSIEDEAKAQLDELRSRSLAAAEELARQLENVQLSASQFDELLQQAGAIAPVLVNIQAQPRALYYLAKDASTPLESTAYLVEVLGHKEADSDTLEQSGDLAREELGNNSLAQQLYQRAIEIDSANVSAESELLRLRAKSPVLREEALTRIRELAFENPNHRVVVGNLLNVLVELDRYAEMESTCEELLQVSSLKDMVWRNIAVARQELGRDDAQVIRAYTQALKFASKAGDYVNIARPYVALLAEKGKLALARQIADAAIRKEPTDSAMLVVRGRVCQAAGDVENARKCYEHASALGPANLTRAAEEQLRELEVLASLGLQADGDVVA